MASNNLSDVSILVVGFDGYIDVWNIFFSLLEKYWPQRPKTYLATSELNPEYHNVTVIPAGPDSEWSKRAYNALQHIDTPYVILMLEDFFITNHVDNKTLNESIDIIKENDIKYYQIQSPNYSRDKKLGTAFKDNESIRVIPKNKSYVLNLQTVIWDKEFLKSVIGQDNYNAWLFEIKNKHKEEINTDKIQYLIDTRNILNITHAIVQSKYLRNAVKHMESIGFPIDLSQRKMFSKSEQFKYDLKCFMSDNAPKILNSPLKAIGRLVGIDFVTDRISK